MTKSSLLNYSVPEEVLYYTTDEIFRCTAAVTEPIVHSPFYSSSPYECAGADLGFRKGSFEVLRTLAIPTFSYYHTPHPLSKVVMDKIGQSFCEGGE